MLLRNLSHVRDFLASLPGTFVGVGMTAFSRITPAYLVDPYHIVALRKTLDFPLFEQKTTMFCLEQETGIPSGDTVPNSAYLLAHPLIRRYLGSLPDPKYLFLYQNYPELESLSRKECWIPLANTPAVRIRFGNRSFLEGLLTRLRLPMIPGGLHPIEELHTRSYEGWKSALGPRFVVQLPEIGQGGGRGTFFVGSRGEYQRLCETLKENIWRNTPLRSVSVHRYLEGITLSVAMCVTRHGVLISGPQRQLIDLPYCDGLEERGVFCGHEWGKNPWPRSLTSDLRAQARKIGESLAESGYRGILGVDFVADEENARAFVVEINPRLTGAFPMLSLLYLQRKVIPMEVFHILEFLDFPYEIDVDALNESYETPGVGSHLLLFLVRKGRAARVKGPEPGLFICNYGLNEISRLGPGRDYQDLQNERQFIVIDGPPDTGGVPLSSSDPMYRLCRILFPHPVLGDDSRLSQRSAWVVNWVYNKMLGATP